LIELPRPTATAVMRRAVADFLGHGRPACAARMCGLTAHPEEVVIVPGGAERLSNFAAGHKICGGI